ncbi:unnamed protein product [Linum trigynum]|uniref:Uncharacterized protein n=1 Tax=Linum trigynum TaxID=586398 RepID=A0AAV2ECI2_9ROSI
MAPGRTTYCERAESFDNKGSPLMSDILSPLFSLLPASVLLRQNRQLGALGFLLDSFNPSSSCDLRISITGRKEREGGRG